MMKKILCLSALVASLSAGSASAATLYSQFLFDSGVSDTLSNTTAMGDGTVAGGAYNFDENEGLALSLGSTLSSYTMIFDIAVDDVAGYNKIIDFAGLGSDNGLYIYSGGLRFYSVTTGTASIDAGTTATIALSYDGTTTRGYVNGIQDFEFVNTGVGYPSAVSSLNLVEDDTITGQNEASAGSLDFFEIYDGALTGQEIATYQAPTSVSTVPLPAGLPMLLAGIGALGLMRRKT